MPELVTMPEVSELLGCSLRTVQRYVKKKTLKVKVIAGKTFIKRESLEKLLPVSRLKKGIADDKKASNQNAGFKTDAKRETPDFAIPSGYILIDNETLESLRSQIKTLTVSVSDMQLTQKLLIQKGLNLKELPDNQSESNDNVESKVETSAGITHIIPVGTEFGAEQENCSQPPVKNKLSKIQNLGLWIALGVASIVLIVLIILTFQN